MSKVPTAALNHQFAFLGQEWRKVKETRLTYDRYKTNRDIISSIEKLSMEQRLINAHAAKIKKAGVGARQNKDSSSHDCDSALSESEIEQLSASIRAINEAAADGPASGREREGTGRLRSKPPPVLTPRKASGAKAPKSKTGGGTSPPKPDTFNDDINKTIEQRLAEKKEYVEKLDIYRMMKEHEERKKRRHLTLMTL